VWPPFTGGYETARLSGFRPSKGRFSALHVLIVPHFRISEFVDLQKPVKFGRSCFRISIETFMAASCQRSVFSPGRDTQKRTILFVVLAGHRALHSERVSEPPPSQPAPKPASPPGAEGNSQLPPQIITSHLDLRTSREKTIHYAFHTVK
jgi:hypothetical protein